MYAICFNPQGQLFETLDTGVSKNQNRHSDLLTAYKIQLRVDLLPRTISVGSRSAQVFMERLLHFPLGTQSTSGRSSGL